MAAAVRFLIYDQTSCQGETNKVRALVRCSFYGLTQRHDVIANVLKQLDCKISSCQKRFFLLLVVVQKNKINKRTGFCNQFKHTACIVQPNSNREKREKSPAHSPAATVAFIEMQDAST